MALSGSSSRILCNSSTSTPSINLLPLRSFLNLSPPSRPRHFRTLPFTVSASRKKISSSSGTGKFDGKNRRTGTVTTKEEDEEVGTRTAEIASDDVRTSVAFDDGFVMPNLPGGEPDFWEGAKWDRLGFFVQYMWAFGVLFALIACGISVVTYNDGATDFKDTPAYKESIESKELLEEPDASNSDVFESNPTEQAPALE